MLRFTLARIRRADSIGIVGMTALMVCAAAIIAGTFAMLFFRAYPFANSDELVLVWENDREISVERLPVTEHAFPIYQRKLSSLLSLAHFFPPAKSDDHTCRRWTVDRDRGGPLLRPHPSGCNVECKPPKATKAAH